MAKLRTILFVLLTLAEIISSKSPPAHENKDNVPRLAYFLGYRTTVRAPVRRSAGIQDYHLAQQVDLVKEKMVSRMVDKEHSNETCLMKKNGTSCHCHRCKCAKRKLSQNSTAPFGIRYRRDTTGQLEQHPLRPPQKTSHQQKQTTVNYPSSWTTINPSKPAASSSEFNPPASSSKFGSSGTSSDVMLPASSSEGSPPNTLSVVKFPVSHLGVRTPAVTVAQTQLREEEDDEDASDYHDHLAHFSHYAQK